MGLASRSRVGRLLLSAYRQAGGAGRLFVILLALVVFAIVAKGVRQREHDGLILRLDGSIRLAARELRARPFWLATASVLTRLTGEGLMLAVVVGVSALIAAGRRRDAGVVIAGTLGAWLLHVVLKILFHIPRPGSPLTKYAVTAYGFPSGHTLVTLVACGLLAWTVGRRAKTWVRVMLYIGAAVIAGLAGAARIIKGAHWLSDVVAGLAVGALWLNFVIPMASRRAWARPVNEAGRAP